MIDKNTSLAGRNSSHEPLVSHQRLTEISNKIISSEFDLGMVTHNTGLTIDPAQLAAGDTKARKHLAMAIARKSESDEHDGSASANRLDSQEINTALTALVNTDLILNAEGHTSGYNPDSDDLCVLAAISGAMVESAIKSEDVKSTIKDTLLSLIDHAGDHALDSFVNQVNTLLLSDEQVQNELAEEILIFATNEFFKILTEDELEALREEALQFGLTESDHLIPSSHRTALVVQKFSATHGGQLAEALTKCFEANSASEERMLLEDNFLTNAILESTHLNSNQKMSMIQIVCESIGKTSNFQPIEDLQMEFIPEVESQIISRTVAVQARNLIEDANAQEVVVEPLGAPQAPQFNIDEDDEL